MTSVNTKRTLVVVICAAMWGVLPAIMLEMSPADLHDGSQLIVHGAVSGMKSQWDQTHSSIYTDVRVAVTRWEKGDMLATGPVITVRVPGGEVGEIGQMVEDVPTFSLGEEVTLYLKATTDPRVFELNGGYQGKAGGVDGFTYSGLKRIPASCEYYTSGSIVASWETAIKCAGGQWDAAGSRFRFQHRGRTSRIAPSFDGYNVVDTIGLGRGFIAVNVATYDRSTMVIIENDIVFNTYYPWSTSGEAGKMDVMNIATHEMGHSLLLLDLYSAGEAGMTMYGYASEGETKKRSLEPGDKDGIKYIYNRTPTAPSNLTGTRLGRNVTLSWLDNSNNEDDFGLERKRGTTGTYAQIATKSPNTMNHPDNNLTGGYTYYYRVRARNGSYYSSYSNVWSVYVPTLDEPQGNVLADGRPEIAVSPNPLTGGHATIRFALPASGKARIQVYDAAGMQVAHNEFAAARAGETQLDLRRLSTGVYLLRLEAGEFRTTQRIVKTD